MSDDLTTRTTTTKTFQGFDARFGSDPDEILVELRTGRPAYIRLREGKYLQEGDAFHRDQLRIASPTLETWEVVEITSDEVSGENIDTGDRQVRDRETIEKRLATGAFSTNLTDFERISIVQMGQWGDFRRPSASDSNESERRYTDRPLVMAIAYGDNGLRYGRHYRFVDEEGTELELWQQDATIEQVPDDVLARLDRRVREELEADGYSVRED